MRIDPSPPFEINPRPEGTSEVLSDDICVKVLPDLNHTVRTRKAFTPFADLTGEWKVIDLPDNGVKLFVNGNHVVVSSRNLCITFT